MRVRITPLELARLEGGLTVESALRLGEECGWRAEIAAGADEATTLRQEGGTLRMTLSPADLQRLLAAETEGVYFRHEGMRPVRYYIEKDFPCVHPRATDAQETPSETFDAPDDFEARKIDIDGADKSAANTKQSGSEEREI